MGSLACDLLVVGAGPAGVATAVVGARHGLRTVLIDPSGGAIRDDADGRAVALMPGSRDRFIDLDLWDSLEPYARPIGRVRIHDTSTGVEHVYRARDLGRNALAYSLALSDLRAGLTTSLDGCPSIERIDGRRLTALTLESGWRHARLDDGTAIAARLVVGADGRESTVREAVGLTARRSEFAQSALIFIVASAMLDDGTVVEQLRPEGPISLLPLRDARFAVTWIDGPAATQRRRRSSAEALLAELAAVLDMPALATAALASSITIQRLGVLQADRFVAPRLALVADAAHGAHPVHAQGFNLGIGDVHELATLWRVEGERFASAETLARFQRSRRLAGAQRMGATDVMNRLFSAANAPWAFARSNVARALVDSEAARLPTGLPSGPTDDDRFAG